MIQRKKNKNCLKHIEHKLMRRTLHLHFIFMFNSFGNFMNISLKKKIPYKYLVKLSWLMFLGYFLWSNIFSWYTLVSIFFVLIPQFQTKKKWRNCSYFLLLTVWIHRFKTYLTSKCCPVSVAGLKERYWHHRTPGADSTLMVKQVLALHPFPLLLFPLLAALCSTKQLCL